MSTTMEVPSVIVEFYYEIEMNSWRLRTEYRAGKSVLTCQYAISDEQLASVSMAGAKQLLFKVVAEMGESMNKSAPWVSITWLQDKLMTQLHEIIIEAEKTQKSFLSLTHQMQKPSASAGTHTGNGAMDIAKSKYTQPLDEWEKELLGYGKPATAGLYASLPELTPSKGLSEMADGLPGMGTQVDFPCTCSTDTSPLKTVIMHLNDVHTENDPEPWTSEEVCEWLDELHDSGVVNLEIEIPDKEITNADSN